MKEILDFAVFIFWQALVGLLNSDPASPRVAIHASTLFTLLLLLPNPDANLDQQPPMLFNKRACKVCLKSRAVMEGLMEFTFRNIPVQPWSDLGFVALNSSGVFRILTEAACSHGGRQNTVPEDAAVEFEPHYNPDGYVDQIAVTSSVQCLSLFVLWPRPGVL